MSTIGTDKPYPRHLFLDVSLCTSNAKMEPRPRTSSRVSSFEFAQKTGTAGLRDSDPALIRNVSISSSRNILSTKDGWPLGDWTNKNTIITRDVTSGRHSKRSSHSAKTNRRSMSNSAAVQDTMPYIQRWAGLTRTASNWDGLRRVCIYVIEQQLLRHLTLI